MATITIQVTNDAGQTVSRAFTVAPGDLARALAALKVIYPKLDAQGVEVPQTDAQVLTAWAGRVMFALKREVRNIEAGTAMTQAGDGVTDISVT